MSRGAIFAAIALVALSTLPAQAQVPVFTGVPADFNVEATSAAGAVVNFTLPTAVDAIGGAVPVTSDPVSGGLQPLGNTVITFTATDLLGNTATATTTATVHDTTPPSITAPANQTINTGAGLATGSLPDFTGLAGVTDTVTAAPTVTQSPVAGSALPIGPNTVTITATDGAGNVASATFTVTVIDNESPVFTAFPSDISIDVDYPDSSSVHSWTGPTATDNSGLPVIITQTAGPASGTSFPLGPTVVTYEADDAAGYTTTQSFTVTVAQTPPGDVTLIVESGADGGFPFTSSEAGLNFTINVVSGTGTSGPILIAPGSYDFAFSVPAGFGLSGAACTDSDSTVDIGAMTGTVVLASAESITCTISSVDAVGDTTSQIGAFIENRAKLIIRNGPAVNRRLERLKGIHTDNREVSSLGIGYAGVTSVRLSKDQVLFSYSLRRSQAHAADIRGAIADNGSSPGSGHESGHGADGTIQSTSTLMAFAQSNVMSGNGGTFGEPLPAFNDEKTGRYGVDQIQYRTDIWIEGTLAHIDATGNEGTFGILHGGFDYLVTHNLLIGLGIQGDWMDQGAVSGSGYLIGPYATARLSDRLYFDARGAWGQSFNEISPIGTYTDDFDAERWLASAAIVGDFDVGAWNIRPQARVDYFQEKTEAYTDNLSMLIPTVEVVVGELTFGPTFTYTMQPADGAIVSTYIGFDGIWTFAGENTAATASPGAIGLADTGLRARTEAGLSVDYGSGFSISASAFYDGIGNDDFAALGGRFRVSKQFQ